MFYLSLENTKGYLCFYWNSTRGTAGTNLLHKNKITQKKIKLIKREKEITISIKNNRQKRKQLPLLIVMHLESVSYSFVKLLWHWESQILILFSVKVPFLAGWIWCSQWKQEQASGEMPMLYFYLLDFCGQETFALMFLLPFLCLNLLTLQEHLVKNRLLKPAVREFWWWHVLIFFGSDARKITFPESKIFPLKNEKCVRVEVRCAYLMAKGGGWS